MDKFHIYFFVIFQSINIWSVPTIFNSYDAAGALGEQSLYELSSEARSLGP